MSLFGASSFINGMIFLNNRTFSAATEAVFGIAALTTLLLVFTLGLIEYRRVGG
jgi:high-affinity Fe2+/Pb2+ permease